MTPEGVRPATVYCRVGRIESISDWSDVPSDAALHDVADLVVMAGLVDTHVHMNEPGRTEWEGALTATRAAAAGGVTTLLDMPLNSIPATTSIAALSVKREAIVDECSVDAGFIGGVVPGNVRELAPLVSAGVLAFKCFLVPSGVDEFPCVSEADLRIAFPVLATLGVPLMVHAEDPSRIGGAPQGGARDYASYLASRPPESERAAIELLVRLMEQWPIRVHVVHLSSSEGLAAVRAARARGLPISAETCPHYLTFAAEDIRDGATEFKCAPPIRAVAERESLWRGLVANEISMIVSDHSPAPPSMKSMHNGDFFLSWGGIASLQLGLSAVWTEAARRGQSIERVAQWMCEAPATLVHLERRKGYLAAGCDADFVIWDPDAEFVVDPARLEHRHPMTPYAGRTLRGVVHATWLRGHQIYADGRFTAPAGTLLSAQPPQPYA